MGPNRYAEYGLYFAYLVLFYLYIVPIGMRSLAAACDADWNCSRRLHRGWMASWDGRLGNDLSDHQWRDFRSAMPRLVIGALVHGAVSLVVRWAGGSGSGGSPPREASSRTARPVRPTLTLAIGLGFLAYVHGTFAVFPVTIACVAYLLAKRTAGTRYATPAAWAYAVLVLVIKERGHRYMRFGSLLGSEFRWLDMYTGEYGWHAGLNLVVLRLVSFHLDLHWATLEKQRPSGAPKLQAPKHKPELQPEGCSAE